MNVCNGPNLSYCMNCILSFAAKLGGMCVCVGGGRGGGRGVHCVALNLVTGLLTQISNINALTELVITVILVTGP